MPIHRCAFASNMRYQTIIGLKTGSTKAMALEDLIPTLVCNSLLMLAPRSLTEENKRGQQSPEWTGLC